MSYFTLQLEPGLIHSVSGMGLNQKKYKQIFIVMKKLSEPETVPMRVELLRSRWVQNHCVFAMGQKFSFESFQSSTA